MRLEVAILKIPLFPLLAGNLKPNPADVTELGLDFSGFGMDAAKDFDKRDAFVGGHFGLGLKVLGKAL